MNLKADLLTVLLLLGFSLCVVGVFFLYRDYESRLAGLDGELKQVKGQLEGFRTTLREDLESLRGYDLGFRLTFPERPREDTTVQVYIGGINEPPELAPKIEKTIDGNAIWVKLPRRLNRGDRVRVVALESGRGWESGEIHIPTIPLQMRRAEMP